MEVLAAFELPSLLLLHFYSLLEPHTVLNSLTPLYLDLPQEPASSHSTEYSSSSCTQGEAEQWVSEAPFVGLPIYTDYELGALAVGSNSKYSFTVKGFEDQAEEVFQNREAIEGCCPVI